MVDQDTDLPPPTNPSPPRVPSVSQAATLHTPYGPVLGWFPSEISGETNKVPVS